MLPFLEPKKLSGVIIARRGKPDVEAVDEMEMDMDDDLHPGLKEAATDILHAVESKSVSTLARALKSAFEICDSYPHEEGPHLNEED